MRRSVMLKLITASEASKADWVMTSSKSRDRARLQSDLVQQVQSGAMTPEDAEAEAERSGIAPLIAQPDPAKFDPMNEVAWTLPMVAAWITFKSLDNVREWWTPYRSEIRYWRLLEEGGREWELASPPPATLPLMFLSNVPISLDRVVREIKTAGRAGRIRATGTCTRTNERREIQAIEWQDLEYVEAGERDALRFKTTSSHGYDDILFGRDEILEEWPPESGVLRTGLPGRPSKSKEWIEGELERRIGAGEITSKTTLAETARSILESLPSDYARPTVGVIKNRIRRRFNEAKARGRQP